MVSVENDCAHRLHLYGRLPEAVFRVRIKLRERQLFEEWLDRQTCMPSMMALKIAPSCEPFVAKFTAVWFFAYK